MILSKCFRSCIKRIDTLSAEIKSLEKTAKQPTRAVQIVSCVGIGLSVTLSGLTLFTAGAAAPLAVLGELAFSGASFTFFSGALVFVTEKADELVRKVKIIVQEFDIEIQAILPVIQRVYSKFAENNDIIACLDYAMIKIQEYSKIVSSNAKNEIAVSELSIIIEDMSLILAKAGVKTDIGVYVLSGVMLFMKVCFLCRETILGKPVTVEIIQDIIKKLKFIRIEFDNILEMLQEHKA